MPFRVQPTGPEERNDWAAALDNVASSISTLERLVRTHADSHARLEERVSKVEQVVSQNGIVTNQTMSYLTEMSHNVHNLFLRKNEASVEFIKVREDINIMNDVMRKSYDNFALMEQRLECLSDVIGDMRKERSQPGPVRFNMTPQTKSVVPDAKSTESWEHLTAEDRAHGDAMYGTSTADQSQSQDQAQPETYEPVDTENIYEPSGYQRPTGNFGSMPQESDSVGGPSTHEPSSHQTFQDAQTSPFRSSSMPPSAPQDIPQSWNQGQSQTQGTPFVNQAYRSPMPTRFAQKSSNFYPPPANAGPQNQNVSYSESNQGGFNKMYGMMANDEAMARKSESLKK